MERIMKHQAYAKSDGSSRWDNSIVYKEKDNVYNN